MATQGLESAEAAAKIQYAIVLLHEKFLELIHRRIPGCYCDGGWDFNKCLRQLRENVTLVFGEGPSKESVKKLLDRARQIRNNYSHQTFDASQFRRDVECLERIAELLGLPADELKLPLPSTGLSKPEDWERLKASGDKFYVEERWMDAINCYTQAIRLNPKAAELFANRALCEVQLSSWELAREDAEDAIELDPLQVKYYQTLSQALFSLSLLPDAVKACQAGLLLDPMDIFLRNMLKNSQAKIAEGIRRNPVLGRSDTSGGMVVRERKGPERTPVVFASNEVTALPIGGTLIQKFPSTPSFCSNQNQKALAEVMRAIQQLEGLGQTKKKKGQPHHSGQGKNALKVVAGPSPNPTGMKTKNQPQGGQKVSGPGKQDKKPTSNKTTSNEQGKIPQHVSNSSATSGKKKEERQGNVIDLASNIQLDPNKSVSKNTVTIPSQQTTHKAPVTIKPASRSKDSSSSAAAASGHAKKPQTQRGQSKGATVHQKPKPKR